MGFPILSSLILLPLLGAIFIFFSKSKSNAHLTSKYLALFVSFSNFILSLYLWHLFDPSIAEFQFLEEQSWIKRVYYPGLPSHPNHDLAKAQMKGFGGMLSFELDPNIKVSEFLSNIILIKPSMSLAGVESTALSPRLTSHALLTEEERLDQGITPQLIRFSCGIEAVEDLQEDLENAIKNCSL